MAFKQVAQLGLWKNQDKNGRDYLGGSAKGDDILIPAGAYVMVRKNDRKSKDTQPDYQLTVSLKEDDNVPASTQQESF